jgi:predicted nucleic acid-binding protein
MDKIIISDTSCLIALSNIEMLDVLRELYQEVIITVDVLEEFGEPLPQWIIVSEVKNINIQEEIEKLLDKGEAGSIALALETQNSTLIIDEIKGRKIAKSLNIEIIGTIGILLLAEKRGLVKDATGLILNLVNKGFRLSEQLIDKIIARHGKQ